LDFFIHKIHALRVDVANEEIMPLTNDAAGSSLDLLHWS